MAFHLRDTLQDAILLRLAKLTDKSKKSATIEKLIKRLDTPSGTCSALVSLQRQTQVLTKFTGRATDHRNERIAHLKASAVLVPSDSGEIKIPRIERLVRVSCALIERLRQLTGDPREYHWPKGDEGSAVEFLNLLNSAHPVVSPEPIPTGE